MTENMTEFDDETRRIQKIVDEIVSVIKQHDVLDVIEALGCTLSSYLLANGGEETIKWYLSSYLIEKAKSPEAREMQRIWHANP